MVVRRWTDIGGFRRRAERWLLETEAEHTVVLGVLDNLERDPYAYDPPVYLATVEEKGEVVGCAFRTPPYKASLTRMPLAGAAAVADDLARVYPYLHAAFGPRDVATRFGERWSELKGVPHRIGKRVRLHIADAVLPVERRPSGRSRPATVADLRVVGEWRVAFDRDVGAPHSRDAAIERHLAEGRYWVWEEEGRLTAMAGWAARSEGCARVAYVYTPPERRGRGYATALVADLTRRLLDEGCRFTVLYTDVDNPIPNAVYQTVGYRPLSDSADIELGWRATT